jgi:acetyl-CoA C-acetyltransferase
MTKSWIISGARTPIGKYLGDLSHLAAPQLAGIAIQAAVSRARDRGADFGLEEIDEVIMGQVLSAGVGQAPARQASLFGGLPDSVGCATVNKVCGSGLYSVMLADRAIRSGDYRLAVAGGMESMSGAPHLLHHGRSGWKYGAQPLLDSVEWDGLTCPHGHVLMGKYAEKVAKDFGVTRQSQDQWALQSHQRAVRAIQAGDFTQEIAPVTGKKGQVISADGTPRADSSLEALTSLAPAFDTEGSVTAGNASSLSDGAAAVLLADEQRVAQWKPKVAFRIEGSSVHAAHPSELFIAPAAAIRRLLEKTGRKIEDIDLFEINEAFASQTLACMHSLGIDPERLNVRGGAIALGHPIGCSGARVLVTLMHAMASQQKNLGIASLCLGGGEAVSVMIRAESFS